MRVRKMPSKPPKSIIPDEEFLSTREAAALTKLSVTWFEKQRCQERGPPYIRFGRTVRYLKSELLAWFSEGRCDHPAEDS
jgi:predicted DNA-binding transcriptional regulator AlpA